MQLGPPLGLKSDWTTARGHYMVMHECRNRAPIIVLIAVHIALTMTKILFFFSSIIVKS